MPSRVLFSVDVELTWGCYRRGGSWQDNLALSFDPAGVGVPYQLEVLARHGLKACFFVDPMPALLYGPEPIRRMVDPILEAGQEVQLHLHPFWADLAHKRPPRFEMTGIDAGEQYDLIRTARDLLIEAGAPAPSAYRAGAFAADMSTIAALQRLGIRYDSSHNGSYQPWPSALPVAARCVAPTTLQGVIELPIGLFEEARGRLRHLQVCAASMSEFAAALAHAAACNHPLTTLVSHSFELATRDGRRVNRFVRGRFENLCRLLDCERAVLPTVHIADLDGLTLDATAEPLLANRSRTLNRKVEQAWVGVRHEKPGETATAATGAGLGGLELLLPLLGL